MEIYDCSIENLEQFSNFTSLEQLYVFFAEFESSEGNLELTSYIPSIRDLTLSSCGEYEELIGVKDMPNLKSLNLSTGTLVRKYELYGKRKS